MGKKRRKKITEHLHCIEFLNYESHLHDKKRNGQRTGVNHFQCYEIQILRFVTECELPPQGCS